MKCSMICMGIRLIGVNSLVVSARKSIINVVLVTAVSHILLKS